MAIPMSVSMQGGSSAAESDGTAGDLAASTGGGYRGTFINNFAARGASVDAASAAGDPGLAAQGGNLLLWGAAAAGVAALVMVMRRK